MKTRLLVATLGLLFSQGVSAETAFPFVPTAKQLYELIDGGKVLETGVGGQNPVFWTITVVVHPKYGLVSCFQSSDGGTWCASGEK